MFSFARAIVLKTLAAPGDAHFRRLRQQTEPVLYIPITQVPLDSAYLQVRRSRRLLTTALSNLAANSTSLPAYAMKLRYHAILPLHAENEVQKPRAR